MPERYDEHYVQSVIRMGDNRNVYTNQAIFTTNKIKLVEKGVKVDSALYERLISHKLVPKIDECLSIDSAITQKHLQEYARKLLNDPGMFLINNEKRTREKNPSVHRGNSATTALGFQADSSQRSTPGHLRPLRTGRIDCPFSGH